MQVRDEPQRFVLGRARGEPDPAAAHAFIRQRDAARAFFRHQRKARDLVAKFQRQVDFDLRRASARLQQGFERSETPFAAFRRTAEDGDQQRFLSFRIGSECGDDHAPVFQPRGRKRARRTFRRQHFQRAEIRKRVS